MGLSLALWSRFDTIFIILDDPDPVKDRKISNHILMNYQRGGIIQNQKYSKCSIYSQEDVIQARKVIEAPIGEEILRKYIAYARINIHPVTTQEVQEYYGVLYKYSKNEISKSKRSCAYYCSKPGSYTKIVRSLCKNAVIRYYFHGSLRILQADLQLDLHLQDYLRKAKFQSFHSQLNRILLKSN